MLCISDMTESVLSDKAPLKIAPQLLAWFDEHGRHDLPWQHPRSPYRVWVAEVMLQQTQVATVIGYFERFMAQFPTVQALADADNDTVMQYWAGLGYYARARNLHAAARRIVDEHEGELPASLDGLMALPGIGRSTAGAIVAQSFDQWAPILDGNAKRVIARLAAVASRPGTAAYEKTLWAYAERYTPQERVADYTQAIMDLGATVCSRRSPACSRCPLVDGCLAARHSLQADIPAPRKRPRRPLRETTVLLIEDEDGRILLEKRPPAGIWGGLWSLPELPSDTHLELFCDRLGVEPDTVTPQAAIRHAFTHFELDITPVRVRARSAMRIMDAALQWHRVDALPGLPAPVQRIINHQRDTETL